MNLESKGHRMGFRSVLLQLLGKGSSLSNWSISAQNAFRVQHSTVCCIRTVIRIVNPGCWHWHNLHTVAAAR